MSHQPGLHLHNLMRPFLAAKAVKIIYLL